MMDSPGSVWTALWGLVAIGLILLGMGWALKSYLFGGYEAPWTLQAPTPPPPPRIKRDFGAHHNPLALPSLFAVDCQESFEQVDARTWQCPTCKLVHFEKASL